MADDVREQTSRNSDRLANWVAEHRVQLVSMGVGLASFLATEFMHHLFVPDMGHRWERPLAEGVSAVVVAVLTAKLMQTSNQLREATLLRMQVISEMNHHIRNALAAISSSTDAIQNQQCIRVISESVDRIEWTLREILLPPKPLHDKKGDRLSYLQREETCRSTYAGQENANE
jgi:signal transduction histidine kinase